MAFEGMIEYACSAIAYHFLEYGVKNMVILLVDDLLENHELCRNMLETLGHQVIGASDGKEAVQAASTHKPDLILMDLRMPGIDGLIATSMLKTSAALREIPVVAMTAYPREASSEKAFAAGCDDYLEKPISLQDLAAIIHRLSQTSPLADSLKLDTR